MADYDFGVNIAEDSSTELDAPYLPPQISCSVGGVPAGSHAVEVLMQPVGAASGTPTYDVTVDVTSVSPATGQSRCVWVKNWNRWLQQMGETNSQGFHFAPLKDCLRTSGTIHLIKIK